MLDILLQTHIHQGRDKQTIKALRRTQHAAKHAEVPRERWGGEGGRDGHREGALAASSKRVDWFCKLSDDMLYLIHT